MNTSTYRMVRQSDYAGARCDEPEEIGQELLAAMEARMLCAEEETLMYKLQASC